MFRSPLTDTIVILVVVLLIFGPKRLPLLGKGIREFKDSITDGSGADDEAERPTLTSAGGAPAVAHSEPAEASVPDPRS